jgi:hypothetical protein
METSAGSGNLMVARLRFLGRALAGFNLRMVDIRL